MEESSWCEWRNMDAVRVEQKETDDNSNDDEKTRLREYVTCFGGHVEPCK